MGDRLGTPGGLLFSFLNLTIFYVFEGVESENRGLEF